MESVGAGYQNTGQTEEKQLSDAFTKGFNTEPGDPRPEIGAVETYLTEKQIAALETGFGAELKADKSRTTFITNTKEQPKPLSVQELQAIIKKTGLEQNIAGLRGNVAFQQSVIPMPQFLYSSNVDVGKLQKSIVHKTLRGHQKYANLGDRRLQKTSQDIANELLVKSLVRNRR